MLIRYPYAAVLLISYISPHASTSFYFISTVYFREFPVIRNKYEIMYLRFSNKNCDIDPLFSIFKFR